MNATLLFVLLFVVFAIFMLYSGALMYHWFKYAKSTPIAMSASLVYMGVGFLLLFIMITAASSIL